MNEMQRKGETKRIRNKEGWRMEEEQEKPYRRIGEMKRTVSVERREREWGDGMKKEQSEHCEVEVRRS